MGYILNSLNKSSEKELTKEISLWKNLVFIIFISLFFLLVIFKLFDYQLLKHNYYKARAESNFLNKKPVFPDRGIIYSSENLALVQNAPIFKVVIDLNTLDRFRTYKNINEILPQNIFTFLQDNKIAIESSKIDDINKDLKFGKDYFVLKSFYDEKEYTALKSKLKNNTGDSEIKIVEDTYRKYNNPFVYANLVGYLSSVTLDTVTEDSWYTPNSKIGVGGLEMQYEKDLRGKKGEATLMYNAKYSVYSSKTTIEPIPGNSIKTTINNSLQVVAYDSLKRQIEKIKASSGAVVVQDPNNGSVLALVNYPSYDVNEFSKGISQEYYTSLLNDPSRPLIDRTISSSFPPGSTFKIITATAGLSEKSIEKDTTILDKGVINIGNFAYRTWKAGGHGIINVVDALKESSDIFFYVLGGGHSDFPQVTALGPWKLYKWSKLFGLGERLGIDLPNEDKGFVASPDWKKKTYNEDWYIGNTYHFAIGQGFVTSTPLQINTAVSAIANGGKIYKPYIVDSVIDSVTKKEIKKSQPQVITSLNVSKENLDLVKEGLVRSSSPGGTAYPLFNYKVKVAGKTGTAEFGPQKKDGSYPTHAWYTAFAPADNPEIAVTVFIEDGGGGSDNAAPVVKDIFDEFFK